MYKNVVCSPEGNNKVLSTNVRLYIYAYALYIGFRNKINLKFDTLDSFCTKISLIDKHYRYFAEENRYYVTFKNGKIDKCRARASCTVCVIVKYPTLALES